MDVITESLEQTLSLASQLGRKFKGGEVVELVGDLGAGKTAFVRGLADAIGSQDAVQSPTFTISRLYKGKTVDINHYDFHRLEEPGVLAEQLTESINNPCAVTVVEWGGIVAGVLPKNHLQINIEVAGQDSRRFIFRPTGSKHQELIKNLKWTNRF